MDETSGTMYGAFYSIDLVSKMANKVIENYGNFKVPDSLEIYRGFGISKDSENQFTSALLLRSKKNGNRYILNSTYKLMKNENNTFILKAISNEISNGQY